MSKKYFLLFGATALLSACVMPDPQTAAYEGYNCRQLQGELELTNNALAEREQKQVVGAALSMLGIPPGDGSDNPYDRDTLRLKDRRDTLQHLLVRRDCYRPFPQ